MIITTESSRSKISYNLNNDDIRRSIELFARRIPRDSGKRICSKNKEGVKMSEWKQMTASNQAGRTVVNQPNITSIDANNSNGSLQ